MFHYAVCNQSIVSKLNELLQSQLSFSYTKATCQAYFLVYCKAVNQACILGFSEVQLKMNMSNNQYSSSNPSSHNDMDSHTEIFRVHRFHEDSGEPTSTLGLTNTHLQDVPSSFSKTGISGNGSNGFHDETGISGNGSNGFHDVKERRDSGFHTMSRPVCELVDARIDTTVSTANSLHVPIEASFPGSDSSCVSRERSSPIVRCRSDCHASNTATMLAEKLFNLVEYERSEVAEFLSKK